MLFQKFDWNNKAAVKRLRIEQAAHEATWQHYYDQYNYALYKIMKKGLTKSYSFNCRARPLLFLMRHSLELCLKYNLSLQKKEVPTLHDFESLYRAFGDEALIPETFLEAAAMVDRDADGAAFRYYLDWAANRSYFTYKDKMEVANFFEKYNSIPASDTFALGPLSPTFSFDHRKTCWDLTFHMGDCHGLGHIRTQYDQAIEFIIERVLEENWHVSRLYLPLLFLIRHSLELALKHNIEEVQKYSGLLKGEKLTQEHSLVTLYNIYQRFLETVDLTLMDQSVREQLERYREQYGLFNRQMHDLDINSRYFRFPVNKAGASHRIDTGKINLAQILKVYYHLDPFITFTNDVLEEQGILLREEREY